MLFEDFDWHRIIFDVIKMIWEIYERYIDKLLKQIAFARSVSLTLLWVSLLFSVHVCTCYCNRSNGSSRAWERERIASSIIIIIINSNKLLILHRSEFHKLDKCISIKFIILYEEMFQALIFCEYCISFDSFKRDSIKISLTRSIFFNSIS